jgi:hypothetical protein
VDGHFFSQVIYAPPVEGLVSWGTQTHHHKIRAYETRHFLARENRWIDAFPADQAAAWASNYKQWGDWEICLPAGEFYQRDGVSLPRPTNSFYQVCWDEHNRRLVFYVASMTFSYNPAARQWKLLHDRREQGQPPALLLWSSLRYDPVNRQVILFGGGGVDRPDGRPHTWALDVTTDRWRPLDLKVEPPARCNSRMVYDKKHRQNVLFGGDAQDSALSDTWVFDVARQQWEMRHPKQSPYQGTDMAFYDVATNRFSIDRTPAFTPEPFGTSAIRPGGRTFFNQPWAKHMRHTCAYDSVRKLGVFTDAGGSEWYVRAEDAMVKHTWLYDSVQRRWLEPIRQPFPGGGSVSPIAVPTPGGVIVYQHARGREWDDSGQMWRFVGRPGQPDSWGWEPIEILGPERPHQREFMTIVHDSRRDRLVFLSYDPQTKDPQMWFFGIQDRRWQKNPQQPPGGISTREAAYVPEQDAILAYGPTRENDPVWTRVYLCAENRWVPLEIDTPQFTVHEVALEYDPVHHVAVLLWPPRFEADLRPHLLRLDVSKLR